jgi:ribonucleoside-diphosphate reductase alpha chain
MEDPLWSNAEIKDARPDRSPESPSLHAPRGAAQAHAAGPGGNGSARAPAQPAAMPGAMPGIMSDTLTRAMENVGDSPACDVCGTITVRSGTCYKCLNCGNSMGCS